MYGLVMLLNGLHNVLYVVEGAIVWRRPDVEYLAYEWVDIDAVEGLRYESTLEHWAVCDEEGMHRRQLIAVAVGPSCAKQTAF